MSTESSPGRKAELWQESDTLTRSRGKAVMTEWSQPFAHRDMCRHRRANISLLTSERKKGGPVLGPTEGHP